jgi:glycosyltransferase involved in cell wall biosynthesis
MRVLVDFLFFSGTRGGTETYVRELYSRLGGSDIEFVGFASTELAATDTSWFPGEMIDSGISGLNRLSWARGELMAVDRAAREHDADLVHSPANLGPVRFGPLRPRVPVVLTLHDMVAFRHPEWVPTRAAGWFLRWMIGGAARNARRITTDSDAALFDIHDILGIPQERIAVVLLAGSTGTAPAGTERRTDLIFSPGNRMPHKGMTTLLAALALMPADRRPTLAVTASTADDPLRAQAAALGVADHVQFNGWLTRDELDRLYGEATAVVLPTRFEGFGLPVLEAMSHGAPVICSDIPVLHEVGGDAAVYVEAGSAKGFAAALERVLGDAELRQRLVAGGSARVGLFSWEKTATEFERQLRLAAG